MIVSSGFCATWVSELYFPFFLNAVTDVRLFLMSFLLPMILHYIAQDAARDVCIQKGEVCYLTLRLLMSCVYIYMELLVKPEMLTSYIYIYGPTFGNAETVSFYLLHNVSTLNQCRETKCLHTNVTQETSLH